MRNLQAWVLASSMLWIRSSSSITYKYDMTDLYVQRMDVLHSSRRDTYFLFKPIFINSDLVIGFVCFPACDTPTRLKIFHSTFAPKTLFRQWMCWSYFTSLRIKSEIFSVYTTIGCLIITHKLISGIKHDDINHFDNSNNFTKQNLITTLQWQLTISSKDIERNWVD